ncbi:Fibroblast growth factor 18 [Liparis tanakae]|uniref:Fibroblast growth factor 18 n=1 Tax=Liparis tanakae TaxID=230148 RepID=A0A4Z2H0Y2_9TELE|nr:Fibroblast growth factor 18 [Liparis tanakae]
MRQLGFLGEDECQAFEVFNRIRFHAASLKNGDRRNFINVGYGDFINFCYVYFINVCYGYFITVGYVYFINVGYVEFINMGYECQKTSADFRFYIENHTRNPDDLSRKQVRIYQLYSRTTGKHVQILGKKVNANGDDGGKLDLRVREAEEEEEEEEEEGSYLCPPAPSHPLRPFFPLLPRAPLNGPPDGRKQECVFVEEFLENNYTALVSAKYKGWYLGFNRKGRPKKGSRTTQRQQEVHFMKRQPKGRPDPLEEFRFTTVTKRTRRARRIKPKRN